MGYRSIYAFAGLNLAIAAVIAYGVQWSASAATGPGPVPGGWVKVSESDSFILYMEPLPVDHDASVRRVWEMFDLKENAGHEGEASLLSLNEYDCSAQRYRIITASGHSGPMGTGQVLWNRSNVGEWALPGESLLNRVCSGRDAQWVRLEAPMVT